MLISQSIQLTCYGMGLLVAVGFLIWIKKQRQKQEETPLPG